MIRSPLVCPISVGREAPVRQLVERLEWAAGGRGTVLLLGGDAGVGKSRTARELKREATMRGVRVIEGRCSSAESSVPYAPLMDALRFRISRGEGTAIAEMLGPLREMLEPLFPQLKGGPRTDVHRTPEPFELIYGMFARMVADDPLLLILEDIHWADQTTLELLHQLAHRAGTLRLLVVATYRSDEIHSSHPLRRLLGALARERSGDVMQLEPLSRADTVDMLRCILGSQPDPAVEAAIWRRSEGNPFFVEELLTALTQDNALAANGTAAKAIQRARLPATVSEAILARVHALGPIALETLSAAAVIGRTVSFDDLREVLGVDEESLVATLEQLVAHQLLREERTGEGDSYAFPHALMQEALYEAVISRRRRLLHRRAAAALERKPSGRIPTRLDQLAYHFRLGGETERACEYSRLAGDEAVRLRAWDDAAAHYENALASLEGLEDDGTRAAELLELLADVAWHQSRVLAGRQCAEEALRLRRGLGHTEEAARLLRRLAALRLAERDQEGAANALSEALKLLAGTPESRELGPIFDDLGHLMLARGESDIAEHLLQQGLSLAARDPKTEEHVLAVISLAELDVLGGRFPAGIARLDESLEVIRRAPLPFERASRGFFTGVRTLLLAHEYQRALLWANAACEVCRKQGAVGLDAVFRAFRVAIFTITGSAEDTLPEAIAAVDELRRTGRSELRDALRVLGFVHRIRGELKEARLAYGEAIGPENADASVGVALIALAEGDVTVAADRLEQAMTSIPADQPVLGHHLLSYTVEALVSADRIESARTILDRYTDLHAQSPEVLHATGLLRLAQGRLAEARSWLSRCVTQWDALGNELEAARARIALLEATVAEGDTANAGELGNQLLSQMRQSFFPLERKLVRRMLRKAGIRTKPELADGPSARTGSAHGIPPELEKALLTTREHMVLREVAQGCTNREIAKALRISEKTVSVHVSHILAKLGCRTRTQAARHATQNAETSPA
jgi:DNA-binding CsgD family transcriptional regulator/tetratricopeptide (TPR) repeat protein